ncbi:MAG: hypothetical protein KAU17_05255 [Spirochaetales bacterium]|nr:hypothetical protein [Spirochaetales bacterium]
MDNEKVKISPPLYLIGMKTSCWRCESKMSVVTLLAPHVEDTEGEICILSNIEELPHKVLSYIQKRVPTFKLRSSKMAGTKYYANTCPKCRVIFGDFFLHEEPGAPFFPTDVKEAKSLYLTEIPLSRVIEVDASLSMGVGELILANANRI